ncbi:LppX_LprAFG lipoprotein [Dactylosporangium sp. AC04546]|uniref:LppX_LprAFG lipoprotein n=1 Tax=Dactylosporangium sp. AC04546 TaxID=2862460 RepID=UPI001EDED6AB|nr:LppX_LprAFG lipoprotein [Dactylosporangium sp. AC04546]WVK83427.1 LppX_LprAFG lipoprotein [Dactylosporangium sp. AC04546]
MPRSQTRPGAALIAALAVLVVALAGCSSKKDDKEGQADPNLPAAAGLLKESSTAMAGIKSAKFLITADGTIAGVALKRAEGVLTKEGSAEGTAQVEQMGTNVELAFTIVGQTMWLKGPTGTYQQLPLALAATVYDPSAILNPDKGIAKVVATATDGKSEATETVEGQEAYRVSAKFPAEFLSNIVPGVTGSIPGKLWIAKDGKRVLKATFELPAVGDAKGGTVTVTFKEFDATVNVSAPQQ